MSGPAYGVVADDLTGAADAGVRFALAGLAVELALDGRIPAGADVVVLNSASRELDAGAAAAATAEACARLRDAGVRAVFKKIDSTLRGHPGAEIAALLDGPAPHEWALVCPAFPEQGRTVVDGRLLVHGCPLDGCDLGALLASEAARLEHAALADGAGAVAERLGSLRAAGARIVVADAASASDLALLVAAAEAVGPAPLYAGSAGLAAAVAGAWARPAGGPLLALIGSLQAETREQARRLAEQPGWTTIEIDEETLVADDHRWERWCADAARAAGDAPPAAGLLALSPHAARPAAVVADRLGRLGAALAAALRPAGVIVSGGETAQALLPRLGAHGFRFARELEPGVPIGRVTGGAADGLAVVLKAGGFGGADVLTRACAALRRGV